jgi:glutathione S-transferase
MSEFPDFSSPITLIGQRQSINTQKVALMMAMTQTPFKFSSINIMKDEHKTDGYESINPFGRIPTFIQGDLVLFQSGIILRYLAKRTGKFGYQSEKEEYEVENWYGFAYDYFSFGLARIRYINRFQGGIPQDLKDFFKPNTLRGMNLLESHLANKLWLALDRPSLAEFYCHPMVAVWRDADILLSDYPATNAWFQRFQNIPGWVEQEKLLKSMENN